MKQKRFLVCSEMPITCCRCFPASTLDLCIHLPFKLYTNFSWCFRCYLEVNDRRLWSQHRTVFRRMLLHDSLVAVPATSAIKEIAFFIHFHYTIYYYWEKKSIRMAHVEFFFHLLHSKYRMCQKSLWVTLFCLNFIVFEPITR